jgi:hypothetical protein
MSLLGISITITPTTSADKMRMTAQLLRNFHTKGFLVISKNPLAPNHRDVKMHLFNKLLLLL